VKVDRRKHAMRDLWTNRASRDVVEMVRGKRDKDNDSIHLSCGAGAGATEMSRGMHAFTTRAENEANKSTRRGNGRPC
jgi:hypothetical protein